MTGDDQDRKQRDDAQTLDATTPIPIDDHPAQGASTRNKGKDQTAYLDKGIDENTVEPSLPIVDGYRIERELARGGMGCLYAAFDLTLDREVAIKVLLQPDIKDAVERFLIESKITARLPHPGIPPVHAIGHLKTGEPFLAMKLVRGRTMAELLKEREAVSDDVARWLAIFEGICQAVGFAHSQAIIHRDLKPANIMVGAFGEVQVMDWGLAKELGSQEEFLSSSNEASALRSMGSLEHTPTQAGVVMGTPAYMPPEQARGDSVDERADVFSLGAVLSMILTGSPAFRGSSLTDLVRMSSEGQVFEAHGRLDRCGADNELIELAKSCLAAKASDRPRNAEAVAVSIAKYRAGVEERLKRAQAEKAAALVREAERQEQRRIWIAATVAVLLVLLVGVVGTTFGLVRTDTALGLLQAEQNKTERALADVTDEKERTEAALTKLSDSRRRNVENLRKVTDELVYEHLERQGSVTDADRTFLDGLVQMWTEIGEAREDSSEGRALQAEGHYRIARLQEWLGERDEAETDFLAALTIQQALCDEYPDRADFQQELARTHNSFAILLRDRGELSDAERHYRRALEAIKRLANDYPDTRSYRQDLAGWQNNLGRLLSRSGQVDEALKLLHDSLENRQQLVDDFPEFAEYRRDIAESQNNLGILLVGLDQLDEAKAAFVAAKDERQRLVDEFPEDQEHRMLLASSLNNLGMFAMHIGNFEEAVVSFKESLDHKESLAQEYPGVPSYRLNLANAYSGLGGVLVKTDLEAAETHLLEGIRLLEEMIVDFPDVPDYRHSLAATYHNLGGFHFDRGNPSDAEQAYLESLRLKNELVDQHPSDTIYQSDLASTLYGSLHAQDDSNSDELANQAISYLQQAVEAGWDDAQMLSTHEALTTIAHREEFRAIIDEIESIDRD